jgi:hypothetical protein
LSAGRNEREHVRGRAADVIEPGFAQGICDGLDELKRIATAPSPGEVAAGNTEGRMTLIAASRKRSPTLRAAPPGFDVVSISSTANRASSRRLLCMFLV